MSNGKKLEGVWQLINDLTRDPVAGEITFNVYIIEVIEMNNIIGSFNESSIVNLHSWLTNTNQTISGNRHINNDGDKEKLKQLIKQLTEELRPVMNSDKDDAERILDEAENVIKEISKELPKENFVKKALQGLKEAASYLATKVPKILPLAVSIMTLVYKIFPAFNLTDIIGV